MRPCGMTWRRSAALHRTAERYARSLLAVFGVPSDAARARCGAHAAATRIGAFPRESRPVEGLAAALVRALSCLYVNMCSAARCVLRVVR